MSPTEKVIREVFQRHIDCPGGDALVKDLAAAVTAHHAALLRLAADGRREYAAKHPDPEQAQWLAAAAQQYEFAAQILGDPNDLKACLPVSRWGEIPEVKEDES